MLLERKGTNDLIMKRLTYAALAAVTLGLTLPSCSTTPEEQQEKTAESLDKIEDKMVDATQDADTRAEWEKERSDVLTDLRNLRDDIDKKLNDCNEKLARTDLKASERKDEEAMKAELEREKGIVDGLVKDVENASETTWATVRVDTKNASDKVKDWWTRFKENMDKKTDRDNDGDGH
jgi:hypothetical protein